MAKRIVKVKRDKNELTYICTECGEFYASMEDMDSHLYLRHSSPILVTVSNRIN